MSCLRPTRMWLFTCGHGLRSSLVGNLALNNRHALSRCLSLVSTANNNNNHQQDNVQCRRLGGANDHLLVANKAMITTVGCCHLSTRGAWRQKWKQNWKQKLDERRLLRNDFKLKTAKYREQFRRLVKDGGQVSKKMFDTISNRILTLPNALCMFRIGITPVVGYMIVASHYEWALAFCAVSAVTDFLDGWIARNFNSESKLGALLDPLADKLLVATMTFTLAYVDLIPLFLAGLILTRDLLIILGGLYLHYQTMQRPRTLARFFNFTTFKMNRFRPTLISKVNTGLQLSLVLVSLSSPIFSQFFLDYDYLLPALQVSTGVTTFASGIVYLNRLR